MLRSNALARAVLDPHADPAGVILPSTECSNEKVHALAASVPSMLANWGKDLRCRFANNAYKDWFGVEPGDLVGTSIRDLLGTTLFQLNEPYMRRALAGEEQLFERLIVSPSGVSRHSLARYTPEFMDGSVVGFFVEVVDVSRLKVAELELVRKLETLRRDQDLQVAPADGASSSQLERIEEALSVMRAQSIAERARRNAFLAQLAHELRNSLAPLKAGAVILGQAASGRPDIIEKVGSMMSRQVSHMSRLIDDVFDVSGIDAGVLSMNLERVDLRAIIEQALAVSMPALEASGHTVVLDGFQAALFVDADPLRLVQVFSNLLNNAGKYTRPGGQISLTATVDGVDVGIAVRDNGIGMLPAEASTVFETFTQLPNSVGHRQGGLGIGLALVRRIVQSHGGTVAAYSAGRNLGSTFAVYLPLARTRPDQPPDDVTATFP